VVVMRYIYFHPLFDERKCAHRFSYQLKNTFLAAGFALERFDYTGTAEAPGEFADISLQSLREDVARYIDGDQVCLVGLRYGATLALDYCSGGQGPVRNLVLLEPVVDGARYVDYLYRKQHIKNLMTGESPRAPQDNGYENIEGYKTSTTLIEQIRNFRLAGPAGERAVTNSVRIVQISAQSKLRQDIAGLAKSLEGSVQQLLVECVQMPVFWERIPGSDYTELTQRVLWWCRG